MRERTLFSNVSFHRQPSLSAKEVSNVCQKICNRILESLCRSVFREHPRVKAHLLSQKERICSCLSNLERLADPSGSRMLELLSLDVHDLGAEDRQLIIRYVGLKHEDLIQICPILLLRIVTTLLNESVMYLKLRVEDLSEIRVLRTIVEQVEIANSVDRILREVMRHIRGDICRNCAVGVIYLNYEVRSYQFD